MTTQELLIELDRPKLTTEDEIDLALLIQWLKKRGK
jgi:hypothetical protein